MTHYPIEELTIRCRFLFQICSEYIISGGIPCGHNVLVESLCYLLRNPLSRAYPDIVSDAVILSWERSHDLMTMSLELASKPGLESLLD